MQQPRHADAWHVPELRPTPQHAAPGPHVTPSHGSVGPGHIREQNPRAPPTPRQHVCPPVQVGMHVGGGCALHVSVLAMHARRASQQN